MYIELTMTSHVHTILVTTILMDILNVEYLLSKVLWSIQWFYIITILPFRSFMCVTYTGYDWLYPWFHGGCVVTAGDVNSPRTPIHRLWFSRVSMLSWVWYLFPALLCKWTNDFKLTDSWWLFPSLYFR